MKLKLEKICKAYAGHRALDAVDLALADVRSLVLIGPSGGGKSTLLRVIAGLEFPDAGAVEINGERVVFEEAALLRHRRTIGTVFQAFNLFPHLTALENITLPLEKVHGHAPAAAGEIARQLLARFRLEKHAARRPAELSGGQRQRVAIARALVTHPKLVLADEPTANLDSATGGAIINLMKHMNKTEKTTFVFSTHDHSIIGQARRVVLLHDGRVVSDRGGRKAGARRAV
jgi:polar amino acid transport system ATP-binding protein